jgi:hypothetical protein
MLVDRASTFVGNRKPTQAQERLIEERRKNQRFDVSDIYKKAKQLKAAKDRPIINLSHLNATKNRNGSVRVKEQKFQKVLTFYELMSNVLEIYVALIENDMVFCD